ncbi:MAG: hypothetical protein KTR31_29500 [Myxococcales bacterium]|nr:hypothetical protein [Myxococcales bacterium]
MLEQACELGDATACRWCIEAFSNEGVSRVVDPWRELCQQGEEDACFVWTTPLVWRSDNLHESLQPDDVLVELCGEDVREGNVALLRAIQGSETCTAMFERSGQRVSVSLSGGTEPARQPDRY